MPGKGTLDLRVYGKEEILVPGISHKRNAETHEARRGKRKTCCIVSRCTTKGSHAVFLSHHRSEMFGIIHILLFS